MYKIISKKGVLILTVAAILLAAPFLVQAVNEVTLNGIVSFQLDTADTAVSTTILAASGGQVTLLDIQSNYIDITLDNLSSITFNTTAPSRYIRISKQSGSNDYTISPTCPTTTATLTGTGAQVVLRLEVYTANLCPPAGGGGHTYIFPANYSVQINNGASTTSSANVSLNLASQNAAQVIVSNDPNFYGVNWQSFITPTVMNWTLEPGEGLKTIYVIYKSSDGNVSPVLNASIDLQTSIIVPPVEPPVVPPVEPPVVPPGGCTFDCSKVTYDLYIVNPDGSQRSMTNGFANIIDLGNNVIIVGFEDKGDDMDFNDVIVKADKSDCQTISVSVLSISASWIHKIKIRIYYNGIMVEDLVLYEDSQLAEAQDPKILNLAEFTSMCQPEYLNYGDILKVNEDTLYYYAIDGKRYVFPDPKTYFSWYSDFSIVRRVNNELLAAIPLARNITHRPGTNMIKINTDPRVYAVDLHGTLRWVKNETVAAALYGIDWTTKINDVSDAFYVNYKMGADINTVADFNPLQVMSVAKDIDTDLSLK